MKYGFLFEVFDAEKCSSFQKILFSFDTNESALICLGTLISGLSNIDARYEKLANLDYDLKDSGRVVITGFGNHKLASIMVVEKEEDESDKFLMQPNIEDVYKMIVKPHIMYW